MSSKSYWETISKKSSSYPALQENIEVDVCIIGGGITGVTAANSLIKQGKKVAILEANEVGGATTSKSTGNLYVPVQPLFQSIVKNFSQERGIEVAKSRQLAMDYIEKVVQQKKINCDFARRPWFAFTHHKIDLIDKEYEALKKSDVAVEYTKELPFEVAFKKAIVIQDQARFNPLQYVLSLAEHLAKEGCLIYENSLVQEISEEKACTAVTSKGKVVSQYLLMATHTPIGINPTQFFIAPHRSYVVAGQSQATLPEGHLWDLDTSLVISTHANGDKPKVLMVSGNHHKTGQSPIEDSYSELKKYFHRLQDSKLEYHWSAQHYQSADALPYVGLASPSHKITYMATGYFADGLTYGTLAGLLIADNILQRECKNPIEATRRNLFHSIPFLVKENANVFWQYAQDLPMTETPDFENELKEGEGKVVQVNRQKLAICRHNNKVNIVSAICPHMKCIVNWNNAEKTWDCPCHGSRFSSAGEYLEGPAMCGLNQMNK